MREMPDDEALRASDAEREEVAARLSEHFGAGRLDQAEFEERLDSAMSAKTRGELSVLLSDLPRLVPSHVRAAISRGERLRREVRMFGWCLAGSMALLVIHPQGGIGAAAAFASLASALALGVTRGRFRTVADELHDGWQRGSAARWHLAATSAAPPPWWRPRTNRMAIASFVLSLVWLAGIGSVLAILFSARSREMIRRSGGAEDGERLAVAGLVLGIIGACGGVLFWLFVALFLLSLR